MQVSSQTCSCSRKKEQDGAGVCGISSESAALPLPSSLICLHSQLRCMQRRRTRRQSSSPLAAPHPPFTTQHHCRTSSSSCLARIKLWRLWAAANWPAGWVARAVNDLRGASQTTLSGFYFSARHSLQAHRGVVVSTRCQPCPLRAGGNLHFHIAHSGRRLIKNSWYGNTRRASHAPLAGERCSRVWTLNQSDGLSTNYLLLGKILQSVLLVVRGVHGCTKVQHCVSVVGVELASGKPCGTHSETDIRLIQREDVLPCLKQSKRFHIVQEYPVVHFQ